jgi:signal transduction histidine kinase
MTHEILGQFYAGKYDRYVVFAAAQDIYGVLKLTRLRIILFIVFIISLFIIYISGKIFVSRALTPISNIMAQVSAIGESNLNARISEGNGKDELSQLAQTFNKMLERIESAFKTQKNFIANASHELRTPLTVITGHMEVILMKARTNEEYRKTIISVLGNIKNLNHISNRLLQLAQTSSEHSDSDFETVRVDEILWQARQDVLKINEKFRINISFSEAIDDENNLQVRGNEQLLRTAISNIMDNRCKYSCDHITVIRKTHNNVIIFVIYSDFSSVIAGILTSVVHYVTDGSPE